MPISVSCSECFAEYSVPEKFVGKRVKCKACGASTPVPEMADDDVIEATLADDDDERASTHSKCAAPTRLKSKGRDRSSSGRSPIQKALLWGAAHPVWATTILWTVWVPLSFLFPQVAAMSAVAEFGLGGLAMALGMLFVAIGVTIRNPFLIVAMLFGAVVSGSTGLPSVTVGNTLGKATKGTRLDATDEANRDTGWAGTLAMIGTILALLGVLHLVAVAVSGIPINL